MFKYILLYSTIISAQLYSQDIIDLGALEIEGEIRRPLIPYTSSKTTIQKIANSVITKQKDKILNQELTTNISLTNNISNKVKIIEHEIESMQLDINPYNKQLME